MDRGHDPERPPELSLQLRSAERSWFEEHSGAEPGGLDLGRDVGRKSLDMVLAFSSDDRLQLLLHAFR